MDSLSADSSLEENIPKWSLDCPICKAIWDQFADPDSASEVNFGSNHDVRLITCPNHKALAQRFMEDVLCGDSSTEEFVTGDMGLQKPCKDSSVSITEFLSGLGTCWSLLLVNKDNVSNHPGKGRLLDVDWADVEILKKWKYRCTSQHGEKCESPLKIWPARPAWLVDVQKQCIVPGHTSSNYAAVSYTYGQHTRPNISSTDFAMLQQPSALTSPEFSDCVSPIIRQAMYLTSVIDERYLWADSLCITHHDREAASEQLQSMGAIYANAVVTIVAADGDSESGLPGLKGLSSSREMSQNVIPFGDEKLIVRNTYGLSEMIFFASRSQPYYSRGWTFQEYAMAKRKIIFNDSELHWVCSCSVWHEETTLYTDIDDEVGPGSSLLMAGFPDEWLLGKYIDAYNQRSLSFNEDALPAISGLLSVLSRSFQGGFLYGIPEMFFDHSLGWRPYFSLELERRVPSARPIENRFAFSGLPSWSWLGWRGSVKTCNDTAIRVNERLLSMEEAFPITEWYASTSPTCSPEKRRRIRSTWYENRAGYKDFTKPMPPGWSRRDITAQPSSHNEPRLYPEGCDRYVFKHESMLEQDGEPLEWFYPFPVNEIHVSTPPSMPEQTQYLFCDTVQARVTGYHQESADLGFPWDQEFRLYNKLGKQIGQLHPLNQDLRDRFPKYGAGLGLPIDVVAVCKLKTCFKAWDSEKKEYGFQVIRKDLYLVLWIEWVNGVAHRLASGKVGAAEWESLELERVSLVLG